MNGNEYIAEILKQEGVDLMTCFPNNPLIETAARQGIRPVAFRHERGAIMAADGISRTSDRKKIGVAAIQSQAGAENAVGGIAQAFADSIPILVLPGGLMLNQLAVKPNFSAVRNYQGIVKQIEAIYQPEDIGNAMRRAFHALRNGPGGPVVVELTADVCAKEIPEQALNYQPPPQAQSQPSEADISDALRALRAAKNPLLWAGQGVLMAGATDDLKELAELTGIPVFCTMPGKSAMDERHPLCLGAGSGLTTMAAGKWLSECDLILALGSSLTRTFYGQPIRSNNKVLIQNTDDISAISREENVDIGLLGDTKLTIRALVEAIKAETDGVGFGDVEGISKQIAKIKSEWLSQWQPLLTSTEEPLNTYRVIHEIDKNLDRENSIVTHDAGAPRDSFVPFYTATSPHSYVGWGKTTHLGFGIPLMIGAKMANPEKFCLNLMGDAAFGMSGTDLETASRSGFAITTVLLNNGNMATYPRGFPHASKYGVGEMQGDYAKIAEGMGAVGLTVTKASAMGEALQQARALNQSGETVLIDVHSNMEAKKSQY
ncbi:MAG: thiamine pyrophosphate-requiring protein [Gammaproteobacteria bacterium]|jgi:acetolactate synthase I/II/III large subunit|nr:thiamine pyrophosphate-requiring protein [Gammaproteobacteria bacterium]MBT6244666.1 thiamine pyrophosphate-requiring protein [Gammaproteobacteria bacterium]